jgi:hypothetical protein
MRYLQSLFFCLLLISTPLLAESKNPADYPLRLHIFSRNETTFYHNRNAEESKGEGRANLFENSEPRGIDFSFECSEKLKPSFGYETYPARWKKPGQELIVLLPVFGKNNAYFTCNLKTQVKDYAYMARDGKMASEPSTEFKEWMTKHEYDPEHGKNNPVKAGPQTPPAAKPQE